MRRNHGLTVVVSKGVHGGGSKVWPVAVVCGGGQQVGGGGERRRATKVAAAACGGGVRRRRAAAACGGGMLRLFSVTSDGKLRGEMKSYVKDVSGHKFAERGGGGVLQICVFMTDIHIIGLKIWLKRHKFVSLRPIFLCLCVFRNAPLSAELFLCTTHVQTTTNILIDACENTMNNGGRRHTTTAIVPHPRLGGVEALAKKAMLQQGYDVKTTTSYD